MQQPRKPELHVSLTLVSLSGQSIIASGALIEGRIVKNLVTELRRRSVFRVAAAYAVIGWIVAQVANIFFPALHLPGWTVTLVIVLLLLGFPVALFLAWAFEITPEGVRRELPAIEAGTMAGTDRTARKLDLLVIALLLVVAGLYIGDRWWARQEAEAPPVDMVQVLSDPGIAVLPLEVMGGEDDDRHLADSITVDIYMSLSRISGLRIVSIHSSMRYLGTSKTRREIGRELNVPTLLGGSVRRVGDSLRLSLELTDASTDRTLWAEFFDQPLDAVFRHQGEVARQVSAVLQVALRPDEAIRIEAPPTLNRAAYEFYRMAQRRWDGVGRETLLEVIDLYQMAIEEDPGFAQAYAELGFAYYWLAASGESGSLDSAWESTQRALELDPSLSMGHFTHATLLMRAGESDEARRGFRRALAHDPNSYFAMNNLSVLEWMLGRFDESFTWARRALERAPDEANNYHHVALPLLSLEADEVAEALLRIALDKETHTGPFGPAGPKPFHRIPLNLARLTFLRGNDEMALVWIREALEHQPENRELRLEYGRLLVYSGDLNHDDLLESLHQQRLLGVPSYTIVLLRRGERDRAEALLAEALEQALRRFEEGTTLPSSSYYVASLLALSGEKEEALDWLERAYETGYRERRWLERDPAFDAIRDEPRYRRLVERMADDISRMRARTDLTALPGRMN